MRSAGLATWAVARTDALGSARARAERRARGEQTRPHPQARTERRRHVAEEISAGRAAAIARDRTGNIRSQPVAAGFAQRIDALHRQAGQVLHRFTSRAARRPAWRGRRMRDNWPSPGLSVAVPKENASSTGPVTVDTNRGPRGNSACDGAFCPEPSLVSSGKHRKILWWGCSCAKRGWTFVKTGGKTPRGRPLEILRRFSLTIRNSS